MVSATRLWQHTQLWQRTQRLTLSVPVQLDLFMGLSGLAIWTLYFSPYPPVHNALHHIRHTTLGVACH